MTEDMITAQSGTVDTVRSIETITAEIVAIRGYAQQVVLASAVQIGRRLVEAKALLPYGEWGTWLKERVEFSQVTATRYMRLFEEYADRQGSLFGAEVDFSTLKNLSVSKALALLAVPADEREEFVVEHDVENLSTRQMDELMAKMKAAEEAKNEAELARDGMATELEGAKLENNKTRQERDALAERVRELENRPIEVAVKEPDPEKIKAAVDAAVAEATAAFEKQRADLEDKLKKAEAEQKQLKDEAKQHKKAAADAQAELKSRDSAREKTADLEKARLEQQIENLKKQLAMSGANVAHFRALFEQVQQVMNRALKDLEAVEDTETRGTLKAATRKLLGDYLELVKGE